MTGLKHVAVRDEYYKQEMRRVGGRSENIRKDWTPAQRRRARKRFNRFSGSERVREYCAIDIEATNSIYGQWWIDDVLVNF